MHLLPLAKDDRGGGPEERAQLSGRDPLVDEAQGLGEGDGAHHAAQQRQRQPGVLDSQPEKPGVEQSPRKREPPAR